MCTSHKMHNSNLYLHEQNTPTTLAFLRTSSCRWRRTHFAHNYSELFRGCSFCQHNRQAKCCFITKLMYSSHNMPNYNLCLHEQNTRTTFTLLKTSSCIQRKTHFAYKHSKMFRKLQFLISQPIGQVPFRDNTFEYWSLNEQFRLVSS